MSDDELLQQQVAYYRARASEYDEWFLREGRYDYGAAHRTEWFAEVAQVEKAVLERLPHGVVLELACGTGLWGRLLAEQAQQVLAVDTSPEAIDLNRSRVRRPTVTYIVADVFSWIAQPASVDAVFFAFWLSHVPTSRFDSFWRTVKGALKPGGRAVFVDGLRELSTTAHDQDLPTDSEVVRRRLNDGREFDIVKVFYEPKELSERLNGLGWRADVRDSGKFFLYGSAIPD